MYRACVLVLLLLAGCDGAKTGRGEATKYSARELYEASKGGRDVAGEWVEVTGVVRASELDRKQLPKLVLEGGDRGEEYVVCYFAGPVGQSVSRRDTVTVRAKVKGEVEGVLTLSEAELVRVVPKKR